MAKLNTDAIRSVIALFAESYSKDRFDDQEQLDAAINAKLWKRYSKMSMAKRMEEFMVKTPGEVINNYWEYIDILDSETPVTEKCITRHFINPILDDGLDPLVVTDPTDTKILAILWHSD